MALPTLFDRVRQHLDTSLSPTPPLIGAGYPIAAEELPAVTISIAEVTERLRGIGRLPAPTLTGALRIDTVPRPGEPGRVVRRRGGAAPVGRPPRRPTRQRAARAGGRHGDTAVGPARTSPSSAVATTLTPVEGAPGAGEVQVLPDTGQLRFPAALAATGTLVLGYFVGEWEVRTARYQGTLSLETFATDLAGVDALSRQVDVALVDAPISGLHQLSPQAWGPVAAIDNTRGGSRGRALTYRFDFELIEPKLNRRRPDHDGRRGLVSRLRALCRDERRELK